MRIACALLTLGLCAAGSALAGPAAAPVRTPLGDVPLAAPKTVSRVQVMRVDFAPGQAMPRHIHPAPVVCHVERGAFHIEIAGQPARDVATGAVTYEPAETPIEVFRNVSKEPGALTCDFLGGEADRELARLLPPR